MSNCDNSKRMAESNGVKYTAEGRGGTGARSNGMQAEPFHRIDKNKNNTDD